MSNFGGERTKRRSVDRKEAGRSVGREEVRRSVGREEAGRSVGREEVRRSVGREEAGRSVRREEIERSVSRQGDRRNVGKDEARRRRIAARRRKIQRRRNIAKIVVFILAIVVTVKLIDVLHKPYPEKTDINKETESVEEKKEVETKENEYVVGIPVKRDEAEVLEVIEELAEDDDTIAEIYENSEAYPSEYLAALANNPEMAEFVKGYLSRSQNEIGEISKAEKEQEYPLFVQWDTRWGYASYGDSNIGMAGCGPTCLSMVIYSLTRNAEATSEALAKYSEENGYYVEGTGTSWSFMVDGAEEFGISVQEVTLSESAMKQELDMGNMIICAVGPGDFTTEGHFIVLYGYDSEGFFVNDPNCKYRSDKTWSYEQLEGQIKNMWAYSE